MPEDRQKSDAAEEEKAEKIRWHLGFQGGMELELRQWKADLEFNPEEPLSKEALVMDLLIIKRRKEVVIDHPLASFYKTWNLVEYKSPNDELSINTFYKTLGYAHLFAGLAETVHGIPMSEISITMIRNAFPIALFRELGQQGIPPVEVLPGVWALDNYLTAVPLPIRWIITSQTDPRWSLPLKMLSPNVDPETMMEFIDMQRNLTEPGDYNNANAVLKISIAANPETMRTVVEVYPMDEFQRLIRESFPQWFETERQMAVEKTSKEIVERMLRMAFPPKQIADCANIPEASVRKIATEIGVELR